MTAPGPAGWRAAMVAAMGLCAAVPPAWFPGGGLLVLVGLAALFRVATCSRRPYRWGYAIGLVHVLWFSWSLRHVTGPGYVAIGIAGAVYFVMIVAWTRAFARCRVAWLGFALGVVATCWLRAHTPEISYPHGQPAHALHPWPELLGPARWGGEVLTNGLLAVVAAGLCRRWRVLAGGAALWAMACLVAPPSVEPAPGGPTTLRVAAFQSDFPLRSERGTEGFEELVRETARIAGEAAEHPPELVLWPESTWPARLVGDPPVLEASYLPPIGPGVRLCAGTTWRGPDGRRAVAVLLDAAGRLVDFHEKRVAVPAGERVPFLSWLPDGLAERLLDEMTAVVGYRPDLLHGRRRPPLRTASDVPFAALTCFDNAHDDVVREAVEDGARFVAVLSNESWYSQGGELEQMVAMTVFRALETGTPVVRSTVDGVTCAVGGDGRLIAALPRNPGSGPVALELDLPLGPGRIGPLGGLAAALAWAALASGLVVLWHLARSRRSERDPNRALDPT